NLTTCCISFLLQQRLPPTSPLFPYTTLFRSDQFLHAYYYKQVKDGNRHPYEEFFARNSKNPELALRDALEWWHDADFDHSFEERDRKSTRLNSSHVKISYAVFCLKKKKRKRK